jgi:hypothetical protein
VLKEYRALPMSNVVRFKKPSPKERAKGRTLCGRGFHKWTIDQHKQFDVRRGKLVTLHRCSRCGETKTTLS